MGNMCDVTFSLFCVSECVYFGYSVYTNVCVYACVCVRKTKIMFSFIAKFPRKVRERKENK